MMQVYYSACKLLYGTPQEQRDIQALKRMFPSAVIINPSDTDHEKAYVEALDKARPGRTEDEAKAVALEYFAALAENADVVAFRAEVDGKITAGVYRTVEAAAAAGKVVIEMPHSLSERGLTVDQTRERLAQHGDR